MNKIFMVVALLSASSGFADYNTVTHFTWDTASNGGVGCYASDSRGRVNAGEQASPNQCCAGDYNTVTHFTWDTSTNGNVGCYASDDDGRVNAGEQPSSNDCCS